VRLEQSSYAKNVKITDRFIGDHKTFRKILFEIGQLAGDPIGPAESARLTRLVELLKDQLLVHTWAEGHVYFPAIRAVLPKAPDVCLDILAQLKEEHETIEVVLNQLEQLIRHHPSSPAWSETYVVFFHELQSHMRNEERDLFPLSERLLGEEDSELLFRSLEDNHDKIPSTRHLAQVL
jgi:iron-sulfur cluster repair protein YtfE (RIC family)